LAEAGFHPDASKREVFYETPELIITKLCVICEDGLPSEGAK